MYKYKCVYTHIHLYSGTGKSYLLKYIVQEMRKIFEEKAMSDDTINAGECVVITAPTGVVDNLYPYLQRVLTCPVQTVHFYILMHCFFIAYYYLITTLME